MTDLNKETLAATLKAKLSEILARKEHVDRQKMELAAAELEIDRDLADLRAAVRVLNVSLPIPIKADDRSSRNLLFHWLDRFEPAPPARIPPKPTAQPALPLSQGPPAPVPPSRPRPPIKAIVLDRLKTAGDKGSKAAPIRIHIERVYGGEIHEKTVGMTLYRLAQNGIVRREGQTWFLVEPKEAETGNPGAETPGSNEDFLK